MTLSFVRSSQISAFSIQSAWTFGVAVSVAVALAAGEATAAAPTCVPTAKVGEAALTDGWSVEGLITDYDLSNRTISVNGMTFVVPTDAASIIDPLTGQTAGALGRVNVNGDLLVNTGSPETPKMIEFSCLVDPIYGTKPDPLGGTVACFAPDKAVHAIEPGTDHPRDLKGATVIASGPFLQTAQTGSDCLAAVASDVEFLFAENVTIGAFDYDPATGQMWVNGQAFVLNQDPRLMAYPDDDIILGLSGTPIDINDLLNPQADYYRGSLIAVEGHYVPGEGIHATILETEAVKANADVQNDTVGFERVEYRTSKGELRIAGILFKGLGQAPFDSVRLFMPGNVDPASAGKSCSGAAVASTLVQADGTFDLRVNVNVAPTNICVESFDVVTATARGAGESPVTRLR